MSAFTRVLPVLVFVWAVTSLYLCETFSTTGLAYQVQERIIRRQKNPNEPVTVLALNTNQAINATDHGKLTHKLLTDDEDWLKGLTVKVKNTSIKNINYVSVRITFVRPKDDASAAAPPLMHSINYGRDPRRLKEQSIANQYNVPPGGTVEVALPDDTYELVRRVLKKTNYPTSIKEIDYLIEAVGFDDGMLWDMGTLLRRDPNDANKFIPLEEQEFKPISRAKRPAYSLGWGDMTPDSGSPHLFRKVSWTNILFPPLPVQTTFDACGSSPLTYTYYCISDVEGCQTDAKRVFGSGIERLRTHAETTTLKICFRYDSEGQKISPCGPAEEIAVVTEAMPCRGRARPCPPGFRPARR